MKRQTIAFTFSLIVILLFLLLTYEVFGPYQAIIRHILYGQPLLFFFVSAVVGGAPLMKGGKNQARAIVYIIFLFLLTLIYLFPMSSRRYFLTDLYKIKLGMSTQQVEVLMKRYKLSPYTEALKMGSGSLVYLHSNLPEYNSDMGTIHFKQGKVIEVIFSPD